LDLTHAVVLGLVQGLTEMLPISSSGHLVIVPWLLGWPDSGLAFDVGVHVGTLMAVVIFFRREWRDMLLAGVTTVRNRAIKTVDEKMVWIIFLATIPGVVTGFLLEDAAETVFRAPSQIGMLLVIAGIVLFIADRVPSWYSKHHKGANGPAGPGRGIETVGWRDGLIVGLAQAMAILPGVSRSGSTMTAGLFLGFNREVATRFSFLLATPIILGAALFQVIGLLSPGSFSAGVAPLLIGLVVSGITCFLVIRFLLKYVQTKTFTVFVVYSVVVGAAVMIIAGSGFGS